MVNSNNISIFFEDVPMRKYFSAIYLTAWKKAHIFAISVVGDSGHIFFYYITAISCINKDFK